jgi:pseudaminic acid biosynthesis-associated methylase
MSRSTKQVEHWAGENGNAYVDRNPHSTAAMDKLYRGQCGTSRSEMNEDFLSTLPKTLAFLEIGANVGVQLQFLHTMGFRALQGIDVNRRAVQEASKLHPEVVVREGSGFAIPFEDASFDVAYTSGVLIHIAPQDIDGLMREMYRVSRKYIWGFEYYAPTYTEIPYRGEHDLLWKTDFAKLFLSTFSDLSLVKEKRYRMHDGNENQMYLLEKK